MRAKIFDLFLIQTWLGDAWRLHCACFDLCFLRRLTANAGNGISGGVRFHKDHSDSKISLMTKMICRIF